jgi:N-acyl-D-amino-acid deacylase
MADLVITGALIVDGSGSLPRPGTLVVSGDRIEDVLGPQESEPPAAHRIDGSERVVAPGFVDVHSHSDLTPLVEPTMDSMLRQGVTTVVVGNCGGSAYPRWAARPRWRRSPGPIPRSSPWTGARSASTSNASTPPARR